MKAVVAPLQLSALWRKPEDLRRCKAAVTPTKHEFLAVTQSQRLGEEAAAAGLAAVPLPQQGAACACAQHTHTVSIADANCAHQRWDGGQRWVVRPREQIFRGKVGFSLNKKVVSTGPHLTPQMLCRRCILKAVIPILHVTHSNSCEEPGTETWLHTNQQECFLTKKTSQAEGNK